MEPDQRHADNIIQDLQLSAANGVTSPGENDTREIMDEFQEELGPSYTTTYRAITARANYLAADRLDLMYAVDELCRGMAKSSRLHWHKLERLGRCLVGNSRTITKYEWQGDETVATGYSD